MSKKPGWSIAFICLAFLIPATAHAQQAKPQGEGRAVLLRRLERPDQTT